MRRRDLLVAVALVVGVASGIWTTDAQALTVYFNDFETAVGSELSSTSGPLGLDTTPTAGRKFLGRADGSASLGLNIEIVSLSLTGLSPHSDATVSLKLFVIQSWDGNVAGPGPDVWTAGHSGSTTNLQNTTFDNVGVFGPSNQCYPSDCPASNLNRTGADEASNSLGYTLFGDSVYDLSYTFLHASSALLVQFGASGLQALDDESWGIDDLSVEITPTSGQVPEPGTLLLLGVGLAGLGAWRARSRRGFTR